jgi:hypothetical protein
MNEHEAQFGQLSILWDAGVRERPKRFTVAMHVLVKATKDDA